MSRTASAAPGDTAPAGYGTRRKAAELCGTTYHVLGNLIALGQIRSIARDGKILCNLEDAKAYGEVNARLASFRPGRKGA